MSFKIDSQLSENQIESDVSNYLGYITPFWSKRFRLISVDEQMTGADKLFSRFVPIYLQFKVSHGLDPDASILARYLNKPLSNIIDFRKKNDLPGNPILYFPLRKIAKTATDFQHNILYNLHQPPTQYALYIAPLSLTVDDYEKRLNGDWYFKYIRHNPFYREDLELYDSLSLRQITVGSNLFLRHHISIPPHTMVTTHEHHYSYANSGGAVAWHGGQLLEDDFRLSTQINRIFSSFYLNDNAGVSIQEYMDFIQNQEYYVYNEERNLDVQNDALIDRIKAFSRFLHSRYQIKLMIITRK